MGEVTDEEFAEARGEAPVRPSRCGECGCELPNHFVYCSQSKPDARMNETVSTTASFPADLARAMGLPVNESPLVLGNETYMALLAYMESLHVAKAAGYSGEGVDTWKNFREAENWGVPAWLGAAIRLGDKYRRLQNILRKPELDMLVGENAAVTAIDLAAYSLILTCLLAEAGLLDIDDVLKALR